HTDLVLIPIAFTSDHIETLFELDQEVIHEAKQEGGTGVKRAESLNGSPTFIGALADVAERHLQSGEDPNVDFFELNGRNNPSRVMGGLAFVPGYTIAPVAALEASETPRNLSCLSTESEAPSVSSSGLDENTSPSPGVCSPSGNDGMKAGLGAGLGIGLPSIAALAALSFFLLRERRINRELRRQNSVVPHMMTHNPKDQNMKGYNNPHELYSGIAAAELSNGHYKVQLPA
ncbi:MAG: hypothetical protein L6R36_002157, partial [Xanthoria steineri]